MYEKVAAQSVTLRKRISEKLQHGSMLKCASLSEPTHFFFSVFPRVGKEQRLVIEKLNKGIVVPIASFILHNTPRKPIGIKERTQTKINQTFRSAEKRG